MDREAGDYLDIIRAAHQTGKLDAHAEENREWDRILARGGGNRAQVEEIRYGPGGREHAGDPREGDYKGGPVAWEPEEKEAG